MASWGNASPHPKNGRTPAYAVKSGALPHKRVYHGCSKFIEYEVVRKLGEGTFGEVHQAKSKKTGAVVALKKILMHNEKDGFPITALREIKLLKLLDHINILRLEEMAVEHIQKSNDKRMKAIMYMVTPYMDHDLSGLLENPAVHFTVPQIKCYMLQLLKGTAYLHDQHILHRDMKAANLLINNKGILQIADFGLARHYEGDVPHAGGFTGEATRDYTTLVVTRWYRPPELLLQLRKYTPAIDLWGVGCVFGEMMHGRPILAGESDQRQLEIIFDLVGSPSSDNMPGWKDLPGAQGLNPPFKTPTLATRFAKFEKEGPGAISLLADLLKLDWRKRVNALDALKHPYFEELPLPMRPEDIPHFEESHELDRRGGKGHKGPGLPPAPRGYAAGNEGAPRPYANGGDNFGNNSRGHPNGGHHPNAGYGTQRGRGYAQSGWGTRAHPPRERDPWGGDGSRSDRPHGEYRHRDRDERRSPRRERGGGDVYVPSYSSGRRDERDRNRGRDDRRGGWGDRDDRHHSSHPRRERLDYDDRSRGGHTRSRSRSPLPPRDRERIRERESIDRDVYRR